jgi:deoxyribonuclease-4
MSIAKGFKKAAQATVEIGGNTFQFFTRNPRGGKAKALDLSDVDALEKIMSRSGFGPLLAHAPYTLNMASSRPEVRAFAEQVFKEDLERLEVLPCNLYNFHPGSHVNDGVEVGSQRIVEILNNVLTGNESTTILLEGMSGKGTEIGSTFEQLAAIIDGVDHKEMMGVCLDTCHLYSAGYDIVHNFEGVIDTFDRVIGLERLKAIHLNDSKMPFNSHKDRHERIGLGTIGRDCLIELTKLENLKHLPFFLETPNELGGYAEEIELFKAYK